MVTSTGYLAWKSSVILQSEHSLSSNLSKLIPRLSASTWLIVTHVTPAKSNTRLTAAMSPASQDEQKQMSDVTYRSVVGSLMFAMVCTRSDIAFAVVQLARFMLNPGPAHWTAAKRVLRYLQCATLLRKKLNSEESMSHTKRYEECGHLLS